MGIAGWSLEVARGREVGRAYALAGPETVLGNAPGGMPGIDLAGQEGDSPRRMAARQAVVEAGPDGPKLRDLDSPGGTFVNQRRVLPGRAEPLKAGDLIQLGSVQLRVVGPASMPMPMPTTTPAPAPGPFAYRLAGGTVCRSWDDVLRVAAQKWADLRDELTSGRVDAWLRSIGRLDLIVAAPPGGSADEHLDAWLARLPTSSPARAELDVHPARLAIRVTPGGGSTARTVRLANLGHRLLRVRAAIEPTGTAWARVDPGTIVVVGEADLVIEVAIPAAIPRPLSATLVVDGGEGGTKRVGLILDAKSAVPEPVGPPATPALSEPSLLDLVSQVSRRARLAWPAAILAVIRFVVALASRMFDGPGGAPPRLLGPAVAFGLAMGLFGAIRGGRRLAGFGLISGAGAGVAFAAVAVAACRVVEPPIRAGGMSSVAFWGLIGLALGALSLRVAPPRGPSEVRP